MADPLLMAKVAAARAAAQACVSNWRYDLIDVEPFVTDAEWDELAAAVVSAIDDVVNQPPRTPQKGKRNA